MTRKHVKALAAFISAGLLALWAGMPVFASGNQKDVAATNATGVTVAGAHTSAVDQNGRQFPTMAELGYAVFEDSGSGSAVLLTDIGGVAPTCMVIHAVCVDADSGTGFAAIFDSASATGYTSASVGSAIGHLTASSSVQICTTYDAQVQNGAVVIDSGATGNIHVYWRRCRSGAK